MGGGEAIARPNTSILLGGFAKPKGCKMRQDFESLVKVALLVFIFLPCAQPEIGGGLAVCLDA